MTRSELLTQWRDSLKLFERNNFSLYVLGCLNTIKLALPLMLRYFWWVFIGLVVLRIGHAPALSGFWANLGTHVTIMLKVIALYAFVMSMRPSVEPKDGAYYRAYLPGIWAVGLSFALLAPYLLPIAALVLLFFFDSNLSLQGYGRSWVQAAKAVWYLLPAFLMLFAGKVVINVCWYQLAYLLDGYLPGIVVPLIAILHAANYATLTVFYVRLKHNYFHLIFE